MGTPIVAADLSRSTIYEAMRRGDLKFESLAPGQSCCSMIDAVLALRDNPVVIDAETKVEADRARHKTMPYGTKRMSRTQL